MDGKQIREITADRLRYIDDNGAEQYVDFEACYARHNQEIADAEIYQQKFVGERSLQEGHERLWIEFYAAPRVRFEFETPAEWSRVIWAMKKAGWHTHHQE